MAGVDLPLVPFEHHYLVTENIPELVSFDRESCVIADVDGEIYVRQEQQGALFGVYEKGAVPWAVNGTPWEYGETDLLPSRLDDLAETLERGFERFPSVAAAGIKRIVNGPFTFTPDGNPLVGPVPGVRNYWSACGVMAGFSQGGGIGLSLARWMVEGEPGGDIFGMDVARFGNYATQPYVVETARQFYETRMNVPFPNEVYPAGRPNRTSPIYDLHKAQNAVFGAMFGLEVPLWFAPDGEVPRDIPGFYRHNNAFASVRSEALAAREAVAVLDGSGFAKYEITGAGASTWLDKLLASKLPEPGCASAAVMLSESAAIIGDLTLMCFDRQRYLLTGSGALQEWYRRRFSQFLPAGDVQFVNVTDHYSCLVLIGPHSRKVLEKLTPSDLSNESFPYMSLRETTVGYAPAKVIRKSIAGELGYEIHVPSLHMRSLYQRIMAVGEEHGMRNLGVRALLSLMLEKGTGTWGREYSPDYTPAMNGMGSFIDYGKSGFVGREAAIVDRNKVPERKLVMLELRSDDSDPTGFEPVYRDGRIVGYITSGGYGFRVDKSLAMAYIDCEAADPEGDYQVTILGEWRTARLLTHVPYDPEGLRMQM
jgi:dimethylglycine dehydrogenase